MNLYTLKNKKGFTIIEVVLVLAVAGLIFLMVFLVLPALQRAQRDAARKQAIANIASQIITYYSNTRQFPKEYIGSIKSKDFPLGSFQSSEIEEVKNIDSRNPIGTSTSEYYANLSGKFNSLYIGLGGVCQKERYGEEWPCLQNRLWNKKFIPWIKRQRTFCYFRVSRNRGYNIRKILWP